VLTLVGEDNPHSNNPHHALYPAPAGCAGHRLATRVLGLEPDVYLARFQRLNLCNGRWSTSQAREAAAFVSDAYGADGLVLLGAKVARAFGLDFLPFSLATLPTGVAAVIPHPSGLSRAWNAPGAYARARAAVAELEALVRESKACR
jgi:hypothetical protein